MHTRYVTVVLVLLVVILAAIFLFMYGKRAEAPGAAEELAPIATTTTQVERAEIPNVIVVDNPAVGTLVASPFALIGSARGTWYFEASFPAELRDQAGNVLWQAPVQAQGDWMTEDFVPFEAQISFVSGVATSGELILHKDNPSGLPEHDRELRIPVVFATTTP